MALNVLPPMKSIKDDVPLTVTRKDKSGGANTRMHASHIGENQATVLLNVDIGTAGQRKKRPGLTLDQDLGNNAGIGLFGYEPDGGTNELLAMEGTTLRYSTVTATGGWASADNGFTTNLSTYFIKVWKSGGDGDVVMIQNGTDNAHEMLSDHTVTDLTNDNDDPPKSIANLFFRGRWWVLWDNQLAFSSAYPTAYAGAFDRTTDVFKIPCGTEKGLVGIRDTGIVCFGADEVWGINPSVTPAATDKAEKLLEVGCVAPKTIIQVGDDVWFLAEDGLRGLFRTIQDKLQLGSDFPLSYLLKDEFESISWAYIDKACAVYFDNKVFLSLPVDASTYNNEVWVFYPSIKISLPNGGTVPAAIVISGWNVSGWAKIKVLGQERLYAIDSNDGKVYRAWYGYDDNGTAINYQEEGREEDMGQPFLYKNGGEVEVKAQSSGDYDLTVSASVDGGSYTTLGTFNTSAGAPTLPATLPFTLAGTRALSKKFHLNALGRWRTIKIKIQHNAANVGDDIIVLEDSIITFPEEYENE